MDNPYFVHDSSYVDEDVEIGNGCRRWNSHSLAVHFRCT